MNYKVITIRPFDRQAKRLLKKYPSLKSELGNMISQLKTNPTLGTELIRNCYKIRLAIHSKGKRGGARVITYFYVSGDTVFLLSIYDKSEQGTITDRQLAELLKQIP